MSKYDVLLNINHNNKDIKKGKVIDPSEHDIDEKQLAKLIVSGCLKKAGKSEESEEEIPSGEESEPESQEESAPKKKSKKDKKDPA